MIGMILSLPIFLALTARYQALARVEHVAVVPAPDLDELTETPGDRERLISQGEEAQEAVAGPPRQETPTRRTGRSAQGQRAAS